jgi:thioredoxin reductase (NADPH)
MPDELFDDAAAFPRLGDELIATLDAVGRRRKLAVGDILFSAGEPVTEFFVVLDGCVAVVHGFGTPGEETIGVHGARRFSGELALMTGESAYHTGVVREAGEAIVLSRAELGDVIAANQQLGDVLLSAFMARRALLIGLGSGVRLIGSHLSPDSRRLREFLTRNRIPHRFLDLETDALADELLRQLSIPPGDTPIVIAGDRVLRTPSIAEAASALNLKSGSSSDEACDTVIVGAGPAGLGAAVYAASEGLTTVLVDSIALGGQASTSSRIENYLGFPAGISGSELAERAAMQAARFGVRSVVPRGARSLSFADGYHVVELDDGQRLRARTVVLATGASYRRLAVARLADFEGAGVYYAATPVEAQTCGGARVAVVGGGNSAGQAAVFLAKHAGQVDLLIRGGDLGASMSRYLVDQVESTPSIELHPYTQIRELHGNGDLDAITVEQTRERATSTHETTAVFVFIGADPCTTWLDGTLAIDDDRFILTGQDLSLSHLDPTGDGRERPPFPLETSVPGVFAVGDVRSGSIKRVASSVGEGATAVRLIHQYLALLTGSSA